MNRRTEAMTPAADRPAASSREPSVLYSAGGIALPPDPREARWPLPHTDVPGARTRVLIVDDDEGMLETCGALLRHAGFDVAVAVSLREGLRAVRTGFDVMLLDVRLGEDDGLDVLRVVKVEHVPGHVVVMTGFDMTGADAEARRLGAGYVEKGSLDVVEVVRAALHGDLPGPPTDDAHVTPVSPASVEWAELVVRGMLAGDDPKTAAGWAHSVGKSCSQLRELCELVDAPAKPSSDLVRILRAVRLSGETRSWNPKQWLNVGDRRTRWRLLVAAGVADFAGVPTLEETLSLQRLITSPALLGELRRSLRRQQLL